jgi:hypothetical protein
MHDARTSVENTLPFLATAPVSEIEKEKKRTNGK